MTIKYVTCLLILGFFFRTSVRAQEKDIRDISDRLSTGLIATGKKTVAVVDFTDLQGCVTELGRYMAEEFSDSLAEEGKDFQVVDRTNLNVLMKENHLGEKGVIDPSAARKLGQISGVDALVAGTLIPVADTIHVSIKVLDSTNARIITAVRGDIARTKGIDDLLTKSVANCGLSAATSASNSSPTSSSPQKAIAITTGQIGDFAITTGGCQRIGDRVQCRGFVTNKSNEAQYFDIDTSRSYMADNLGMQSKERVYMSMSKIKAIVGSGGGGEQFEPNLPLGVWISGQGLSEDATSVSIVLVTGRPGGQSTLRNMAIEAK